MACAFWSVIEVVGATERWAFYLRPCICNIILKLSKHIKWNLIPKRQQIKLKCTTQHREKKEKQKYFTLHIFLFSLLQTQDGYCYFHVK